MLTGVTITGADDAVNPNQLSQLSEEFSFVEWGILVSESRQGTPRYPTRLWMAQLGNVAEAHVFRKNKPPPMLLSAHFCGSVAREAFRGRLHPLPIIERVRRIQLNGYDPKIHATVVEFGRKMPAYDIILQVRDVADLEHAYFDVEAMGHGSLLFDPSGGTGKPTNHWPPLVRGIKIGYAGGITPETVVAVIQEIESVARGEFWIDMESGVRTDDRFDLQKVRAVLEATKPLVRGGT